jgi:hypothetical protein
MKTVKYFFVLNLLVMASCSQLMKVVQSIPANQPLTQNEIIAGLKEALKVGTDSSVKRLARTDGYYGDLLVKIVLPPEADILVKNVSRIPGGTRLLDEVILKINRAAEDAASEAGPIFWNSIRNMTFSDALGILKGNENAATTYLKETTSSELFNLYNPKIRVSLDKRIVGDISATKTWDTLVAEWNKMAKSGVGQVAGFRPVEFSLNEYLTRQALNGLFLKIANEEKKIRQEPVARVTDLLKRVFGS